MRLTGKLFLVAPICAVLIAGSVLAKDAITPQIGKKVEDFSLQDFRGKSHSLADSKDAKFVVLAFLGVECPLCKLYGPRLEELSKEYGAKGVTFLGVDSNRQDSVTEMAQYAKVHQISFPLLKDLNNTLADQVGATRTPQVVVLDADRKVVYSGRIDDQYGFDTGSGYSRPKASSYDLKAALDELVGGKTVSKPKSDAIGCLIGRVLKSEGKSDVTYSNQIARLFQNKCVECHRPGQIGPFAIENYEEAVGWAEMIEEVVRDGRMPPWHADPKYGHFKNNMSLTADEKDLIYKWVAAGAPEGDRKDLPEPKQYAGSWMMPGGPDLVVHMPEEVDIPAEGTVDYRYYVADTGLTEDKWVQVGECMPGNRSVVHHMIVFLAPPDAANALGGRGRRAEGGQNGQQAQAPAQGAGGQGGARRGGGGGGGAASFGQLCGFAPGTRPVVLPQGMAKLIPAGWKLVFQMHYTPNGSPAKDRSSVGVKFVKDPSEIKYRVATANAGNVGFKIPPHDPNHKVESTREYKSDVLLLSLFPHMHLRGKDFHYEVIYPDGTKETLMNTPRYDFNWQTSYVFVEPKKLPAGTVMHCTAHFDNSADNPANPDPSKAVTWGDQTWEEMMLGWFDIAVPKDANMAEVLSSSFGRRAGNGDQAE